MPRTRDNGPQQQRAARGTGSVFGGSSRQRSDVASASGEVGGRTSSNSTPRGATAVPTAPSPGSGSTSLLQHATTAMLKLDQDGKKVLLGNTLQSILGQPGGGEILVSSDGVSVTSPTTRSRGKVIAKGARRRDEMPPVMKGVVLIASGAFMGQALDGDTGDAAGKSAVLTAALHLTMPAGSDFRDKALRASLCDGLSSARSSLKNASRVAVANAITRILEFGKTPPNGQVRAMSSNEALLDRYVTTLLRDYIEDLPDYIGLKIEITQAFSSVIFKDFLKIVNHYKGKATGSPDIVIYDVLCDTASSTLLDDIWDKVLVPLVTSALAIVGPKADRRKVPHAEACDSSMADVKKWCSHRAPGGFSDGPEKHFSAQLWEGLRSLQFQRGRAGSLLGRVPVESIDRDIAFRVFLPWVPGHEGETGADSLKAESDAAGKRTGATSDDDVGRSRPEGSGVNSGREEGSDGGPARRIVHNGERTPVGGRRKSKRRRERNDETGAEDIGDIEALISGGANGDETGSMSPHRPKTHSRVSTGFPGHHKCCDPKHPNVDKHDAWLPTVFSPSPSNRRVDDLVFGSLQKSGPQPTTSSCSPAPAG